MATTTLSYQYFSTHPKGEITGRDAQSAFNTVRREHVTKILRNRKWLREWIDDWLAPRRFGVELDGNALGAVTVTRGTPEDSPLIYMSSMVWEAERRLAQRGGGRELRHERRTSYWPLFYIDDVNGVRVGGEGEMDEALEEAARAARIRWDRSKDWKGRQGNLRKHLGVIMQDQRRHQKYRSQKANAAWELVRRLEG